MGKYDGRVKMLEKRMPRADMGDGAIVGFGPMLDENGTILNPEEYFLPEMRGVQVVYLGYTPEQVQRIEEQRFLYWQSNGGDNGQV